MYLSRIELDLSSPAVRQALRNCQDMHKTLLKAFDCTREQAGLLYRVFQTRQSIYLYAQSMECPQWERIENTGYRCTQMKDISALTDVFSDGMVLRFSLLAVPSKKVGGEGKNSKRELLRGADARMDWLKRQGDKYGFQLLEAYEAAKEQTVSGQKSSGEFYLAGVPFEGALRITDSQAFIAGFQRGIGPEKAYGYGLLMLTKTDA